MILPRVKTTHSRPQTDRLSSAASSVVGGNQPSEKASMEKPSALSEELKKNTMCEVRKQESETFNTPNEQSNEEVEAACADHSNKSDDFRDCLDTKPEDVKVEEKKEAKAVHNEDKVEITEVADVIEIPEPVQQPIKREMSRRNSSSGIPVSVLGKAPSRTSPKPTPRGTGIPRKAISSNLHMSSDNRAGSPSCRKNMDQFLLKKRKLEQMKKEIIEKQKPVFDLYQNLLQLKKKLEECGKNVTLDAVKLIEYDDVVAKSKPDASAGGETFLGRVDLDATKMKCIREAVQEIPQALQEFCKGLVEKRNKLIALIEKYLSPGANKNDLLTDIEELKVETNNLENSLKKVFEEQEKRVDGIVEKWAAIAENSEMDAQTTTSKLQELQQTVKKQETHLKELTAELHKAKQLLKEKSTAESSLYEDEVIKLKEKITAMEKQVELEKRKTQVEIEKGRTADLNAKSLRSKLKELDHSKSHYESKISQLTQDLKNANLRINKLEKNFEKEMQEMQKSRNLDKSVIERLNKDKSTFETRLGTATDTAEAMKSEFEEREAKLRKELADSVNEVEIAHSQIAALKNECEVLHKQIVALEQQNQHSADVMSRKKNLIEKPETDRECELQIEIMAQRTAIRALQEKIQANTKEKLHFIETIEKMNGSSENVNDSLAKALLQKEEELVRCNQIMRKNDEQIRMQRLEIETLTAKMEHLNHHIENMSAEESSTELKNMLKEGKNKLEQALMKSLENEHKIIKYEHELAQKNQTIANLENMMKVRDGLIGCIKAKKDELVMENNSLTKYSEEIRSYVLESKEEIREKTEIIHELQMTVEAKQKETHKLENKIHDLEDKLASTNEKRYNLQQTITYMEKELQATKAQINQIEDMQTRYEHDTDNMAVRSSIGLAPWNETSANLYERYRSAYEKEQKLKKHKSKSRNSLYEQHGTSTLDAEGEDTPCKLDSDVDSVHILSVEDIPSKRHILSRRPNRHHETLYYCDRYDTPKIRVSKRRLLASLRARASSLGWCNESKSQLRERVSNRSKLVCCEPSREMVANSAYNARDIIARSCSKIQHSLDTSINMINENKMSY